MLVYYTLFLFIAFGAKLLLALVMIYMLLPQDRRCDGCNEETLLIQQTGVGRLVSRVTLGRVQRRWCPRCAWYGFSRRIQPPASPARTGAAVRTRSSN